MRRKLFFSCLQCKIKQYIALISQQMFANDKEDLVKQLRDLYNARSHLHQRT